MTVPTDSELMGEIVLKTPLPGNRNRGPWSALLVRAASR